MICQKCKAEIPDNSVFCNMCGKKQIKTAAPKVLKRANGTGSVTKLPGRRHKPYAVRVTDFDCEGNKQRRYVSYHETKTEALRALEQELIAPSSTKQDKTFQEVYFEWIETKAFTELSRSTKDNYTAAYKKLSKLYRYRFRDIRTKHIQEIIDSMVGSDSTKNKVKLLCGILFKYAMQNDMCDKNYASYVVLKKSVSKEKEIKKLFADDGNRYTTIILILLYTGLRINELFNLTKKDVDLENGILKGGLKTDAGKNRIVPIHSMVYDYIEYWYNQALNENDTLFYRDSHEILTSDYFRKNMYYTTLERLGIRKLQPHSTRHTCATLLAESGASTEAIKQILGHSNYAFTADTYTHVDLDFLKINMQKIKKQDANEQESDEVEIN